VVSPSQHTRGHQGGTGSYPKVVGLPASPRFLFLKETLEALPAGANPWTGRAGRYFVFDTKETGLSLQVTERGVKSYYFRRKVAGRSERILLGHLDDKSVTSARKAASRAKGAIDDGRNPNEAKRAQRADLTVREAIELYTEEHLRPNRKPKAIVTAEQLSRDYLAPLLTLKLSDLSRARVAAMHTQGGKRSKTRANRALEVLSAACSFVIARGQAPARWHEVNPCTRIPRNKENERERYLAAGELARFLKALEAEPPDLADFFSVLLYTGARRANVQGMAWSQVDLTVGTWEIPASSAKAGKPISIVLVPQAVELLKRRKADHAALARRVKTLRPAAGLTFREIRHRNAEAQQATNGETWVFPSWGASGHLVEPKKAWRRILKRAKIEDVRVHDLRRTLGSWLAAQGASAFAIGKALGHASIQSTKVYARLDLAPVRAAVERVAMAFDEAAKQADEEAKKVLPLAGRHRRGGRA
jgi:integrase